MKYSVNDCIRAILYFGSFSFSSIILLQFTPLNGFDKKELLMMLVSVNSIIVAIIVSYLFSKLFSEKTIRVERKKEIDELSKKVTYLRRVAYRLRNMYDFWRYKDRDVKSIIDNRYPDLLYEEYRGYKGPQYRKLTYEQINTIGEDIFGTDGQAYLALKGLEDDAHVFSFFVEFNPKNYSADDIARYKEYANSVMYFLENFDKSIYDFKRVRKHDLDIVAELYFKITGRQIDRNDYRGSLSGLFNSFEEEYFRKHHFLTSLNADRFPDVFRNSFSNMVVFLILLMSSLFLFSLKLNDVYSYRSTLFLLSLFLSNAIDLIVITFISIRSELDVREIFRI